MLTRCTYFCVLKHERDIWYRYLTYLIQDSVALCAKNRYQVAQRELPAVEQALLFFRIDQVCLQIKKFELTLNNSTTLWDHHGPNKVLFTNSDTDLSNWYVKAVKMNAYYVMGHRQLLTRLPIWILSLTTVKVSAMLLVYITQRKGKRLRQIKL